MICAPVTVLTSVSIRHKQHAREEQHGEYRSLECTYGELHHHGRGHPRGLRTAGAVRGGIRRRYRRPGAGATVRAVRFAGGLPGGPAGTLAADRDPCVSGQRRRGDGGGGVIARHRRPAGPALPRRAVRPDPASLRHRADLLDRAPPRAVSARLLRTLFGPRPQRARQVPRPSLVSGGGGFLHRWDQAAFDPAYESLPLEFFEPMVRRVFAREPFSLAPREQS